MTLDYDLPVLAVEDALNFIGNADLFIEIAEMLLDEIPEQMALVAEHSASGDLHQLSKTAHRLKGNFGVVAAHQAQAVAKQLEHSARAGQSSEAMAAVGALETAVARVVPELERHISQAGG